MGQAFSEPVTEKESSTETNDKYLVASSSIQGWRISMEDSHTILLSMPDDPDATFFAVFDGHGGAKVANYASENLHHNLCQNSLYQNGQIVEALKAVFVEFDEMMFNDEKMRDELAGSTAVVCLIKDSQIYCANIGDSRAVASFAGRVDPLSNDHKPTNEKEMNRIVSAGGWVQFNRVNGNLALSRAFGDFVFKRNDKRSATEQIVVAYPDVQVRQLNSSLEFIIMACDGVWDVMTNEEVVEFVRRRLIYHCEPVAICEELITRCLAPDCQMGCGIGCDNMTVILICYLNGSTFEEFCERIANSFIIPLQQHIIGPIKHHSSEEDDDDDSDSDSDSDDENSDNDSPKIGEIAEKTQLKASSIVESNNGNTVVSSPQANTSPTTTTDAAASSASTDAGSTVLTIKTPNAATMDLLQPESKDEPKKIKEEQICDKSKEIIVEHLPSSSLLSSSPSSNKVLIKANIRPDIDTQTSPSTQPPHQNSSSSSSLSSRVSLTSSSSPSSSSSIAKSSKNTLDDDINGPAEVVLVVDSSKITSSMNKGADD